MFDEDPFNVFDETTSSAEKPGRQTEPESSRTTGTRVKHHEKKGHFEKSDNKRYECFMSS